MDVSKEAGDLYFNYTKGDKCKDKHLEFESSDMSWLSAEFIGTLDNYDNVFKVHYEGNPGGSRTGYITPIIMPTNKRCDSLAIEIHQDGDSCGCGDLRLTDDVLTWLSSESGDKSNVLRITGENCISNITVSTTSTKENHFTASVGENSIVVNAAEANASNDDIDGTVTVEYKSSTEDCSKSFIIKHEGRGCGCGDFSLRETSLPAWEHNETSPPRENQYVIKEGCQFDIVDVDWTYKNQFDVTYDSEKITVFPKRENSSDEAIDDVVKVTYKIRGSVSNCPQTRDFAIKQKGTGCACDIDVIGISEFNATDDSTVTKTISYDYDSNCIGDISFEYNETYFTIVPDTSTKTISVSPKGKNEDKEVKSEIIRIKFKGVNGFSCDSYEDITVKQKENDGCDCGLIHNLYKDKAYLKDTEYTFIYPRKIASYDFASGATFPEGGSFFTRCGDFTVTATTSHNAIFHKTDLSNPYAGYTKFNVEFTSVGSNDSPANSLRIYFEEKNTKRLICEKDFLFLQRDCNCIDAVDGWRFSNAYLNGIIPAEGIDSDTTLKDVIIRNSITGGCISYDVNTTNRWITNIDVIDNGNYVDIRPTIEPNTGSSRTGKIYITPKITYDGNVYSCSIVTFTLTQEALNCNCGEEDQEIEKEFDEIALKTRFNGKKLYHKSCFSSTDPNDYFDINLKGCTCGTQSCDCDWLTLGETNYRNDGDFYKAYKEITLTKNETGVLRTAEIELTVNLKNGTCKKTWTLKQNPQTSEDCATAINNVKESTSEMFPSHYYSNRNEIARYTGQSSTYTLKQKEGTSQPTWLSSISNDMSSTSTFKNNLYADFAANSGGTTGTDPMYKTDPRSGEVTVYLEGCNETKKIKVYQAGWSGSCGCWKESDIAVESGNGCTYSYGGEDYEAFKVGDTGTGEKVLCYFKYTGDSAECGKIEVVPQDARYFKANTLKIVEDSSSKPGFTHKVVGAFSSYAEETTPISFALEIYRNIGGNRYEDCNLYKPVTIYILKGDEDCPDT